MKTIIKTSRLAGALEKLFRQLNEDFFNNALETPIISIMSDRRAYGSYTVYDAWKIDGTDGRREINISAGQLDRPIENICATMLHEMCHYYNDTVLHEMDTSNRGYYHNAVFKATAESHGLICHKTGRYGWSDTSSELSDELLTWILEHDIPEIRLNRPDYPEIPINTGKAKAIPGTDTGKAKVDRSGIRRWVCPKCGTIIRSTKEVRVICADCMELFVQS